jgi:prepilin-type N-terminal cleavage/methylation domain-containing protein
MKTLKDARNQAMTLVELLVVVAVIGILISLLLPATQAAREAARQAQCENNLRQTGLALLNFESIYRVFPASGSTKPGPGNPEGSFISWRVFCLPYIERANDTNNYRMNQNWWHDSNLQAGVNTIPTFVCPSTPDQPPILSAVAKAPRPSLSLPSPLARCDYETIMGVRPAIDNAKYHNNNRFSVMHRDSQTKIAAILDGTSQTILVTESAARPNVYRQGKSQPTLQNDQGYGWIDSESAFSLDGASSDGSREGCGIVAGCSVAINARNDNEPYSFHPAGALSLFVDGHVSFESEIVSLSTFAAQVTRAAED